MSREAIVGSLLGTAVGDALGLPYEGLSRQRVVKLFGAPTRHGFFFGAGMIGFLIIVLAHIFRRLLPPY